MHVTGPGGRLDVHVDFNVIEDRKLFRRVNLLLFLNPRWEAWWGGELQLWDRDVKTCERHFLPQHNRCVIFETSNISYHGVTPVSPKAPLARHSFAVYYYTREVPPEWSGRVHSTIFHARPDEKLRGYVLMPAERLQHELRASVWRLKRKVKDLLQRGRASAR